MIGLCAEQLTDWPKATEHLGYARAHLPLLADYIGYHAASAAYFAHQPDAARTLAAAVAPDSIVGADAEMLVGDVLRDANDWPAVAAHYEGYLKRRPHGPRRSEARYHVAEAKEHTSAPPADTIALYRRITVDDPLSPWARNAHERILAIATAFQLDARKLEAETAGEHIARGKVLFDAMRNPESERAFDDALSDPKISVGDRCVAAYHKAQSRFKARDRKGAAAMFDDATAACKAAHDADLEIKSNYQAGRSYAFVGEHDAAIKRYQAAEVIDPKHSYADDALLREAEEWTSLATRQDRGDAVVAADPVSRRRQRRRGDVAARLARLARPEVRRRDQLVEETDRAGATRRQLLRRGRTAVLARPRLRRQEADQGGDRVVASRDPDRAGGVLRAGLAQPAARDRRQGLRRDHRRDLRRPERLRSKAPAFAFQPRPNGARRDSPARSRCSASASASRPSTSSRSSG